MVFALGGISWLTPTVAAPAPSSSSSSDDGQPNRRPPMGGGESHDPGSLPPQKKQHRSRRAPVSLDDFTASLTKKNEFCCCKKLDCVASFASPTIDTHSAELLQAEQDRFAALSAEGDRKLFVSQRAPFKRLALGSMMAAGRPVCTRFFTAMFGVSKGLIDAVKGNAGARASSTIGRWKGANPLPAAKKESVTAFIGRWADEHGQKMPHKDATYLYLGTKKELLEFYHDEMMETHENDAFKYRVTESYFNRVWTDYHPNVKLKSGGDFMKCDVCTLINDTLHGSRGVQATRDTVVKARVEEEARVHRKVIADDRQVLADARAAARRAKADGKPLEAVYMSADAANQTAHTLPSLYPPTHAGDKGWAERQKIMGVSIEGQAMDFYLTPQTLSTGSNLVCTAIYHSLLKLFEAVCRDTAEMYIAVLYLQLDNCVGENKNNILMAFLCTLVARGVIGKVVVNFMMVGHTHIDIDQIFSRLAEHVRYRCIFTRTQQREAFKEAYQTVPVSCVCLRNLGNFKGLFHATTKKIPNITKPRSFLIERGVDGEVCISFKEYMHSAEWTGMDRQGRFSAAAPPHRIFIGPVPRMRDAPDYLLKEVEEKTVRSIEQRYRASHDRLPSLYLFDSEKVEQAKAEMQMSADLLRVKGPKPFDLPTYWLREEEDSSSRSDSNSSIYSDSNHSSNGDSDIDSECDGDSGDSGDGGSDGGGDTGSGRGSGGESGTNSDVPTTRGHFAFFLADQAPFLVGQITDVRRAQDGVQESASQNEVRIHWWSPASARIRAAAASVSLDTYAKGVFARDHVPLQGNGGHRRLIPDQSWEPVSRIATTCPALIGKGKKIPGKVIKVLAAYLEEFGNKQGGANSGELGSSSEDDSSDDEEVCGRKRRR